MRRVLQKGEDGGHEEETGKEDADERGEAVERGVVSGNTNGGAEVGAEGEEWAGDGLRCSIASEEGGLGEPAGGDYGGFEKGKDDVASAENESAAAIEGGR